MTQPNPNKRQHPPTPIGRLLNKYAISLSEIRKCLASEGVEMNSKATLHRIVHLKASEEMVDRIYPKLIVCLSRFLVARGLDKSEIDSELTTVFTKGEYQPMITQRLELGADACEWFGFIDPDGRPVDPFSRRPTAAEQVFVSPTLQRVIDRVIDAARYQDFVLVSGDIGSGKTTVRASVAARLALQDDVKIVRPEFYQMEKITPMQMADAILDACGVEKMPNAAVRRSRRIYKELAAIYRGGDKVTIDIDEGHHLRPDTVSSLKNFHEMGSGGFQRYLGIVIYAQPKLLKSLESTAFREILERIVVVQMPGGRDDASAKLKVPPFRPDAVPYLAHRLKYVGKKIDELFDEDSLERICAPAATPLQLGNIANRALSIAHDLQEKRVIGTMLDGKMQFAAPSNQKWKERSA